MSNWEGRVEDFDLLTGRARFGGDLRVEGALWLGFVRSPVARATIASIEATEAEALDGVLGVYTADDLDLITQAGLEGISPANISRPPLAQGSVSYVGEAVAAVVAVSEAVAADACDLVAVDYQPLPPIPDLAAAAAVDAPLLHPAHGSNTVIAIPSGDRAVTRAALDRAVVTVTVAQHYPRVTCSPIEGVAGLVIPEGDRVAIHINAQMPSLAHEELAATLATADDQISLVVPPIGGGFGGKCDGENGLFAVAARLALRLNRPLRLAQTRPENLLRPDDFPRQMPSGLTMDEADHLGALERALDEISYPKLREEQTARRVSGDHRLLGIGLSCWADFTGRHEPCQPASARVTDDGRIEIDAGIAPIGQGMQTIVTRLAAETLGLHPAHIVAATPDTGRFRSALGSFGSRSASLAGSSAVKVAEQLLDQLKKQAADWLEAAVDDIELYPDATLRVRGTPSASIPLSDLAGTEAAAAFDQGQPTFSGGTHVAVVEVDTETGEVNLIRHVAVTDCGRVFNEAQASGQVQGGAVQGIAIALFEEMCYDADANPLTTSLADYLVPAASDVPEVETHFIETPTDRNPLGAKGVGESGTSVSESTTTIFDGDPMH